MHLLKNQRGQGLIEYVILVALVGVACMGFVRVLQHTVQANLARTINALQGKKHETKYESISDDDVRKRDFSDFMNGTASQHGK